MVSDPAPDSEAGALPPSPEGSEGDAGGAARRLIRAARMASLATVEAGVPHIALVTPATAPDLSVLLLLSTLARHTRALAANPACALLFTGEAGEDPNPQTIPRVSLTGRAERCDDAALKARFLAVHPYAGLYAGFGDFALWRVVPEALHYVGGFARAFRLPPRKFALAAGVIDAIAAAEPHLLARLNAQAEALARLAGEDGVRAVALDADGFDLELAGPRTRRIAWPAPLSSPEEAEAAFAALLASEERGARGAGRKG